MSDLIDSYLNEWVFEDTSEQWFHQDGWWTDNSGVLIKMEHGEEVYKNTKDFITPKEAKLAAFLIDNYKWKPVTHPDDCHCAFCD